MSVFKIVEDRYIIEQIPFNGNRFLNGNGYFGIRGTLEEYRKENMPAINMAGIYDRVGDAWRESVNAPNPLYTYVVVDGVKYTLPETEPAKHLQEIDFYNGIHKRETVWNTEKGSVTVICERFASMSNQHAIGIEYSIQIEWDAKVELFTGIDGDVWDINGPHFSKIDLSEQNDIIYVCGTTYEKGISVKTQARVKSLFEANTTTLIEDKLILKKIEFDARKGNKYTVQKVSLISSSVDDNPLDDTDIYFEYTDLKKESVSVWNKIWDISKIEIDGDEEAEMAINYSIYHLNCIAPRNLKSKSIAARGLSGQVYKGAVFWDTEMFMLDYYLFTEPKIAKTLLEYRIDTISGALDKAKSYGYDGAFYAWESQEGGYDACSDYNVIDVFTKRPMRTFFRDKQVHISSAIVYAMDKYVEITGDDSLLVMGGAKVIIEVAKFYRSLLRKRIDNDFFEIYDVIGPDEYHERVNNNAYTNAMAKFVFESVVKYKDYIDADVTEYKELAERVYIQKPNKDGLIEQFDGYFNLEDCSIDDVRGRLLDKKEYWGGAYGVASDTQIIKQADVVAMLCMLPNGYTKDEMQANLDYYEPRTEHGSSLSACMYSMLSCKVGNVDFAYPLFIKSAKADLTLGGKEWAGLIYIGGTHPASEGGAWQVAVKGFAGAEIKDGELTLNPKLPKKWSGMRFKLRVRDNVYSVNINRNSYKIDIM